MKKCFDAEIKYKMDENHPDISCVKNWRRNRVFKYKDTYSFASYHPLYESEEEMREFIESDLKLVAGGGYNADHIYDVQIKIRPVHYKIESHGKSWVFETLDEATAVANEILRKARIVVAVEKTYRKVNYKYTGGAR